MNYLFFDTETTGLIDNSSMRKEDHPRIFEFYGVVVDDAGTVYGDLEFICDPGIPLPTKITQITGVKTEDVKGKPPFSEYAEQVARLIAGSDAVVAHNLSYDKAMIDHEMSLGPWLVLWPTRRICTVEQTLHLKGHRMKLGELYENLFYDPMPKAHRAKEDVQALIKIFFELKKRDVI